MAILLSLNCSSILLAILPENLIWTTTIDINSVLKFPLNRRVKWSTVSLFVFGLYAYYTRPCLFLDYILISLPTPRGLNVFTPVFSQDISKQYERILSEAFKDDWSPRSNRLDFGKISGCLHGSRIIFIIIYFVVISMQH